MNGLKDQTYAAKQTWLKKESQVDILKEGFARWRTHRRDFALKFRED